MGNKKIQALMIVLVLAMGCGYIHQERILLTKSKAPPETTPVYQMGDWVIARGSVHNHTTFSDGCRSPEDLIQQARNEGIAVLGITDHREGRTCVGKHHEICANMGGFDSKKVGTEKYFEQINRLSSETESPLVLTGFEIGPYMWNEGYFPYLTLKATHWHFTVYGIDTPELYAKMPAPWGILMKPQPDPGIKPYADFVNYVIGQGGLVFQAHPESTEYQRYYDLVYLLAAAPTHLTDNLLNLTGVAVIPSGLNQVGQPAGEWDRAQAQYLAGIREKPLWATGDSDFECPDLPYNLRTGTTLFYLKSLSKAEVFKAMRAGKMVALMGNDFQDIFVSNFSVSDQPGAEKIMLGEEVKLNGPVDIRFSLNKEIPVQEAKLIRNGKVIATSKTSKLEFRDEDAFKKGAPVFYRVELVGEDGRSRLFTNPIFVDWTR